MVRFIEYIVVLATTRWFVDAISIQTEVGKYPIDPLDEELLDRLDEELDDSNLHAFQYQFEDCSRKYFQRVQCNMFAQVIIQSSVF